jgi:hypothetical protein
MNRAVDIGPVETAAFKTQSGKVRVRLLFTIEQLEALLAVAREGGNGPPDDVSRSVTLCHAPESEQNRTDEEEGDDVRERARAARHSVDPPPERVFVIEGTKAWDAWMRHRSEQGIRGCPTTTHTVDGQRRQGWFFPSLFPAP